MPALAKRAGISHGLNGAVLKTRVRSTFTRDGKRIHDSILPESHEIDV
jgi:hypothetical protein